MMGLKRKRSSELGEWVLGDLIGKGGFGSVYKAYPLKLEKGSPAIMAVKVAEVSDPNKVDALFTEAKLLSQFQDCPFVINSFGEQWTYKSHHNSFSFNLLLEFAAGGTIRDRIQKSASGLSECEIKEFTRSVLSGLQCIHDKGYVHCDIKPDNILLVHDMTSHVDFVAKIGDFGLTKSAQNEYSRQGTASYLPPETVISNIQGKPSDIWALGCLVLEMLTGTLWPCKTSEDLGGWVSNPIIPSHLSEEAKDFLAKCLDIDASKRFTAERLLTHSFLMSKQSIEQVAKVPALSQSQHSYNRLPSFIPLGDSSSQEAQKNKEGSGLYDNTIFSFGTHVKTCYTCGCRPMVHKANNFCCNGRRIVFSRFFGVQTSNHSMEAAYNLGSPSNLIVALSISFGLTLLVRLLAISTW